MNDRPLRNIAWAGDSREKLRKFPKEVKQHIGRALDYAQRGGKHPSAKPLKGFGSGVFEIVANFKTDTYRAVYALKIGEMIYVLHVFQKKSKTSIKTPQREIQMIHRRLKIAQEIENERRKN